MAFEDDPITELDALTEISVKASVASWLVECPLRMGVGGDLIAKLDALTLISAMASVAFVAGNGVRAT
jgi:hypothetical protein